LPASSDILLQSKSFQVIAKGIHNRGNADFDFNHMPGGYDGARE
jgi:hypothetical protein